MWFNPFVAQLDVMCGTETGFGGTCQVIAGVTNQNAAFQGDVQGEFGVKRDSYWPRSVAAMVIGGAHPHRPVRPARVADPPLAHPRAAATPPARRE